MKIFFHIILFLLTFFTTTIAGVQWIGKNGFDLENFYFGLPYSISILGILTFHEFGHYFAAKFHGIKTTFPFFIPIPSTFNPFGTMGAVIKIKEPIQSKKILFDIGIAGPIAGIIATFLVFFIGVFTIPNESYLYEIHPEFSQLKKLPEYGLTFGNSILFSLLSKGVSIFIFFPPMNEVYHYHLLNATWFGLFITAMNLIPVGQLDGGHILYALIGKTQEKIAYVFLFTLIVISLSGFFLFENIDFIGFGWLIWVAILFFIIKPKHPEIDSYTEIDIKRKILGWSVMIFFTLTFVPYPFYEISK